MCLILFSFNPQATAGHQLVVAANRDEFFARATANADYWSDDPNVLGGRDLVSKGTWLGITKSGRFAAVTNVREPDVSVPDALSRGQLTQHFLQGTQDPLSYLQDLRERKDLYSGFNLLVGEFSNDGAVLYYFGNRSPEMLSLEKGVFGLSNGSLDSNWPKVNRGKRWLKDTLQAPTGENNLHRQLRQYLEDGRCAADNELPSTGISLDKERALSSAFIQLPEYGTRASTVLTINSEEINFSEKVYDVDENKNQAISFYNIKRKLQRMAM
jgi:uncharacterized protein with NRDE domain